MRQVNFLIVGITLLVQSSCNFTNKSIEKTIYIGSNVAPCMAGVIETECMQVKWTKDQESWENFFGQIDGFDFEKGFEYELAVREEKVKNPPADAPAVKYSLVKINSKNKVEMNAEMGYSSNSRNSLDWEGTYVGILPCGDCEGIKTTVSLFYDGTYNRTLEYLGKNGSPFKENGKFEWNSEGSTITLMDDAQKQQYKVGENQLFHLDNNGAQIKGNLSDKYILIKADDIKEAIDFGFENKKWRLINFMGKEVKENENEYYIIFNSKEKKLNTKVGCNVMNASYELSKELNLKIKPIMSTMMACPENSIEDDFKSNLETVNNVTTNGKLLHLNRARMIIATYKLAE